MKTYRTIQGDTWDLIALKMYPKIGGEKLIDILLEYNTEYMNFVILPANIILNVPDILEPVVLNLPAWKR